MRREGEGLGVIRAGSAYLDRGFSGLDGGGEEVQVAGGEAGGAFFLLLGSHDGGRSWCRGGRVLDGGGRYEGKTVWGLSYLMSEEVEK